MLLQAQPYDFRHYQVENGLSNNAVICTIQDKNGFLWFGTKDGLNRFDGYSFKVYRHDPDQSGSIGSNFIHCLFEDKEGTLWVGTENGLFEYNPNLERFHLLKTPVIGAIRDIQMDKSGNLWFISNFTLHKLSITPQRSLQIFPVGKYFEASSICILPNNDVWVSTGNGYLRKYNSNNNSFSGLNVFSHSPRSVSNWIEKIYATQSGDILIGTSNQGAKIFDPVKNIYKDFLTYNTDKTEIFVRNFIQTSISEFWIATETGIYIYDIKKGTALNLSKKYNDPYAISDNAVYSFCKDKEGGVWAGTYFGGVNYWPPQRINFIKYFPKMGENALGGNVVREMLEDKKRNLWIGTEDAGLYKLDKKKGHFQSYQPTGAKGSISYSNIHGLLINGEELWIGTFEHGLDVMNILTGKIIRHYSKGNDAHSMKSNFIYSLYRSPQDSILVCTTAGVYVYQKKQNNFLPLAGLPLYNWYTSILIDRKGNLWAGTYGSGLHLIESGSRRFSNFSYQPENKNSLASNRINCIFEDSQSNIWIATEGGLCKYDYNTHAFKRYTTQQGFPTNYILSILEDNHQKLWISSSKGLIQFNPKTEDLETFTKENGLLNDQFNFRSAYKDQSGNLYFGTVKGFVRFNPDQYVNQQTKIPVLLTGLQINNQPVEILQKNSPLDKSIIYTDKIVLQFDQSTFNIDFAALSYSAPELSNYAYKMENLDKEWTFLKTNRKVYFTDLAPGKYIFKVKTVHGGTANNDPITQLIIVINPPWWLSPLAYFIYFMAIMLLTVYLANNYHIKQKEKNRRKIEQLSIKKEKELYEAKMEFFTNIAHEIKTPLTLIKGPLEQVIKRTTELPELKGSLRIMEKNTEKLIELTHQLLDFRQTEIYAYQLHLCETNITEFIKDTISYFKPLAEPKNIQLKFKYSEESVFAMIDVEAFEKILNNIFSNAIKYGEHQVLISLEKSTHQSTFLLRVMNDGLLIPADLKEKIFEPFFRIKENEKHKGTGIGLALARSLTTLHKGTIELLESENNMNVILLEIPLYQQLTEESV